MRREEKCELYLMSAVDLQEDMTVGMTVNMTAGMTVKMTAGMTQVERNVRLLGKDVNPCSNMGGGGREDKFWEKMRGVAVYISLQDVARSVTHC